jgi:transposase
MATKKQMEDKRERAKIYYLQGETQKAIAQKIGVSEVTVGRWAKAEKWSTLRAGTQVTRTELINKNLELIARLLDGVMASDNPTAESVKVADQISKLAASIERLDKKTNVVNEIDTFINFNRWLQARISFDKELSSELIKTINKYQDIYVGERMSKN